MSKICEKIIVNDEAEMTDFARDLAKKCRNNEIFALKGSLGVGKSFLARSFIKFLTSPTQNVASPTFNLVFDYESSKGKIYHFDLYRIKSEFELENIGFFDALKDGICLIEWPEIAEKFLPERYYEIIIENNNLDNESQRQIQIIQYGK